MEKSNRCIRMNAKDSIFVGFFRDRENVFELYKELHPEDRDSTLEDVAIRTAKRVLSKGFTNDLGFSVGDRLICLVEAQGYRLRAMNLRTLFYLTATFQGYLSEKGISVYEVGDGDIPKWEAYVVSMNGPGEGVYRLNSLGGDLLDGSLLEAVTASEDTLLMEYIKTCHTIDSVIKEEGDSDPRKAFLNILEKCRDRCGRIGQYVWSRRFEVMGIYEQLFDDEENLRMLTEAYRKEGLREGRKEGIDETRLSIVRNMLSRGLSEEEVSDLTGIPLEDIVRITSGQC